MEDLMSFQRTFLKYMVSVVNLHVISQVQKNKGLSCLCCAPTVFFCAKHVWQYICLRTVISKRLGWLPGLFTNKQIHRSHLRLVLFTNNHLEPAWLAPRFVYKQTDPPMSFAPCFVYKQSCPSGLVGSQVCLQTNTSNRSHLRLVFFFHKQTNKQTNSNLQRALLLSPPSLLRNKQLQRRKTRSFL